VANPLKQKLLDRYTALQTQRSEKALEFQGILAHYDDQIAALRTLAQQWDTMTVDQALTALEQTGITLDLKA